MKKVVKRRSYHSEKRQRQAEETRVAVVGAARRLFARSGYHATTLEAIAAEAGVSVQTVYAVFGSKRGLMLAISDDMDVRGGFATLEADLDAAAGPREQLRVIARVQAEFYDRNADVLVAMREAGQTDDGFAELWKEAHARHRAGNTRHAKRWVAAGALRAGLDAKEAADTMAALTWIDVYWYFVDRCGWRPDRYRDWLVETIERLLLTPAR